MARFIGTHPINMVKGEVAASGHLIVEGHRTTIRSALPEATTVSVGIRPEDMSLGPAMERRPDLLSLPATIQWIEDHGADLLVHCLLSESPSGKVAVRIESKRRLHDDLRPGSLCMLNVPANNIHLFDQSGRRSDAMPAINLVGGAAQS